jgi:hypothetical protein
MALPILQVPKHELELLSSKQKVTYRPFLVKEQKVLMQALQTGGREDVVKAVIACAEACTFDSVKIEKLPFFDLERLFLFIRSKSVGEIVPINVRCDKCDEYSPVELNLIEGMKIANAEGKFGKLEIRDGYGLIFDYPNIVDMSYANRLQEDKDVDEVDYYYRLAKRCLKGVYNGEDFFTAADSSELEKDAVFNAFGADEFQKMKEHFDSMPAISYDLDFKCVKCGTDNHLHVEGLDSFFG